jgi:hypothetical protein
MTRANATIAGKICGRLRASARSCGIVALTALIVAASASVACAAGPSASGHHQVVSRIDGPSGVPVALLIAFAGAVLGALAAYAGRVLRTRWSHRRGLLTGLWLWVTYNRGDGKMERPVFSIELLEIKHRHSTSGEKIRGTAWRVFAHKDMSTWDRRWTLTGYALDRFVECVYKSETGGGNGVVNMWRTNPGYEGEYIPARKASRRGQPHDSIVTEWARLPRELPQQLKEAIELIPEDEAKKYPRRVRRALGLGKPLLVHVKEWLPYAVALSDNQLALQATQTNRPTEGDAEQEKRSLEIYRRDLGLLQHSTVRSLRQVQADEPKSEGEHGDTRSAA